MRIVAIVLIASLTAAAQVKVPTYTTELTTRQVPRCEAGWHLEQWHYGNDGQTTTAVFAVLHIDPSGYRAVAEAKQEDPHPDICVKDEPKK